MTGVFIHPACFPRGAVPTPIWRPQLSGRSPSLTFRSSPPPPRPWYFTAPQAEQLEAKYSHASLSSAVQEWWWAVKTD